MPLKTGFIQLFRICQLTIFRSENPKTSEWSLYLSVGETEDFRTELVSLSRGNRRPPNGARAGQSLYSRVAIGIASCWQVFIYSLRSAIETQCVNTCRGLRMRGMKPIVVCRLGDVFSNLGREDFLRFRLLRRHFPVSGFPLPERPRPVYYPAHLL